MIRALRVMPAIATKVLRDGTGDVADQSLAEPPSHFRLESLAVGRRQVVGRLAAAIGDHLGQTAELVIGQAGRGCLRSNVFGGPANTVAVHTAVLGYSEARMLAANRTMRLDC
jgi:hypothetical protein